MVIKQKYYVEKCYVVCLLGIIYYLWIYILVFSHVWKLIFLFSVCNLSEEEFKLLESKITRYGNLDRLISSPRHDTYVSCRFMITRDSDYSKILFADYDNPRKRGTYSFDFKEETFNYLENSIPFTEYYAPWIAKNGYTNGFKIYTTETYKDVLKYYQEIADKKQNPNMKQKQKDLK